MLWLGYYSIPVYLVWMECFVCGLGSFCAESSVLGLSSVFLALVAFLVNFLFYMSKVMCASSCFNGAFYVSLVCPLVLSCRTRSSFSCCFDCVVRCVSSPFPFAKVVLGVIKGSWTDACE